MESKRGLYKQRSRNGLGSRESRARLKEKESKSSRDALLLSKRRIPLSAVQEESKTEKEKGGERMRQHTSVLLIFYLYVHFLMCFSF